MIASFTFGKSSAQNLNVRRFSRFAKCNVCESLRAALEHAGINGHDTINLNQRKRVNIEIVRRERLE